MNTTNITDHPVWAPHRAQQAGIACPSCGCTEMRAMMHPFLRTGRHRLRLECAECEAFRCWLPEPGRIGYYTEPVPGDAHEEETAPPAEGTAWLGHIRQADGKWKPVVLASTLEKAWEELLGMPGKGDILIVPTEDNRKTKATPKPSRN